MSITTSNNTDRLLPNFAKKIQENIRNINLMMVTMADPMITVSTTMVDAVMALVLDGDLDCLDYLEGHFLGDVDRDLNGLDVLKGFGDGNVLDNGDLNGNLDRVGFGDQLDLGGDGRVRDFSVSLSVDHLGFSVDRVPIGIASVARDAMSAMTVVAETVGPVEVRHRQA